jgi:hypothetical protein
VKRARTLQWVENLTKRKRRRVMRRLPHPPPQHLLSQSRPDHTDRCLPLDISLLTRPSLVVPQRHPGLSDDL